MNRPIKFLGIESGVGSRYDRNPTFSKEFQKTTIVTGLQRWQKVLVLFTPTAWTFDVVLRLFRHWTKFCLAAKDCFQIKTGYSLGHFFRFQHSFKALFKKIYGHCIRHVNSFNILLVFVRSVWRGFDQNHIAVHRCPISVWVNIVRVYWVLSRRTWKSEKSIFDLLISTFFSEYASFPSLGILRRLVPRLSSLLFLSSRREMQWGCSSVFGCLRVVFFFQRL